MKTVSRRILSVSVLIATFVAVAVVVSIRATQGTAVASPPAAARVMSALDNPSLRVSETPQLLQRLGPEMAAAPGTIRRLANDLGKNEMTVWVWRRGVSDSICLVSTKGGGGCLDAFRVPFDISITDYDRLGQGDPVAVWGPVTDEVVSIEVTANGEAGIAAIRNNIAYYELPDSALLPSSVEKVVAHLRDGSAVNIRV